MVAKYASNMTRPFSDHPMNPKCMEFVELAQPWSLHYGTIDSRDCSSKDLVTGHWVAWSFSWFCLVMAQDEFCCAQLLTSLIGNIWEKKPLDALQAIGCWKKNENLAVGFVQPLYSHDTAPQKLRRPSWKKTSSNGRMWKSREETL